MLKPEHQDFKANTVTRELNTSGHQKHELRRQLQSSMGLVCSGVARSVRCPVGPVRLIVTPILCICSSVQHIETNA